MSYKCVTVVISRVSQYRFVVLLSGASAVGLYRKHVSIPVCVMVCTLIRFKGLWLDVSNHSRICDRVHRSRGSLKRYSIGWCGAVNMMSIIPVCYALVV